MSTIWVTKVGERYVGHNENNFGNFLWGAGTVRLGVPNLFAVLGAHLHNYLYEPSNQGKKWYQREFDSDDDQFSIGLGFQWANEHK
jgi:hypothetical protein